MKLSIITVNLNNVLGLKQTIDSVLNQTWTDFEYIIVDGASTDGSKELIERLTISDERLTGNSKSPNHQFKWISEPDSGVFQAMNKGIRMSSGDYLLFLNSGDYLVDKDVLKTVFYQVQTSDFLIGTLRLSKNNEYIGYFKPADRITFKQIYNFGLPHQASFIKRDTFDRYGLYKEDFKYNADIEYWIRTIIINACSTKVLDVVVSDYNMEGISSLNSTTESYKNEIKEIYSHPHLQSFIPDYDFFKQEQKYRYLWNWIEKYRCVFVIIHLCYKVARKLGLK